MPPLASKKKPIQKKVPLKHKAQQADAHDKHVIYEQRKEIARLQKLLAKTEVKKDSEIAKLRALLTEEKKNKIKVVINKRDANA